MSEQNQIVEPETVSVTLEPENNERLSNFCGQFDEHIRQIEDRLNVEINNRGAIFSISGASSVVPSVAELLRDLYEATADEILTPAKVNLLLQSSNVEAASQKKKVTVESFVRTKRIMIKGRGRNQQEYIQQIKSNDINFGVGPAGTGKTYLAVACAVEALETDRVRRIILVRPAVEAGERLGFLPGDLAQKIDPYLRPLYDALYEMLGFERVAKLIERNVIEIAPLAYMRGRTLNESFIIMDEAQNSTVEQMKMFLTRIGFGSVAVVTGDVTQVDLPRGKRSGLRHALDILKGVEGISASFFNSKDVVRHPLVQKVVEAYEKEPKEDEYHG